MGDGGDLVSIQIAGKKDWPVDGVEENKQEWQHDLAHQLKLKITTSLGCKYILVRTIIHKRRTPNAYKSKDYELRDTVKPSVIVVDAHNILGPESEKNIYVQTIFKEEIDIIISFDSRHS